MSIYDNEALQQQEQTAEIYTFESNGVYFRYTNYLNPLTVSGNLYQNVAIKHAPIIHDVKLSAQKTTITISFIPTFISDIANSPANNVSINIKRVLVSDTSDSFDLLTGVVSRFNVRKSECNLECKYNMYELDRKIPKFRFQSSCNNQLFDTVCNLNKTDYTMTVEFEVTFPDLFQGNRIPVQDNTPDGFGNNYTDYATNYFQNGIIKLGNEFRLITANTSPVFPRLIIVQYPFSQTIEAGTIFTIVPGCDKTGSACRIKFDNLENFTGIPYINTLSPMHWGIRIND